MRMRRAVLLTGFILMAIPGLGQTIKLSGTVRNIHGERLPSARVSVSPDSLITLTNSEGEFVLQPPTGSKRVTISFVGYRTFKLRLTLTRDTTLDVVLEERLNELRAVQIDAERNRQDELFRSNQTSTNILSKEDITSIPVLGGEADVIKTLQLLPGTVRGIEGSSDLFVRGGAADQNLVLLDGAPIYNTSHLFGFLSVFNPDVLDQVESINGGFPARFGGRLSSILNVNTIDEIAPSTQVSGDIGLIASRLMIEQPLVKDKVGLWVAARRTYIDKLLATMGQDVPYFFYDVNSKLMIHPDEFNTIELTYYGGLDVLDWFRDRNGDGDGFLTTFESGNNSQVLEWKRELPGSWRSHVSLNRSKYKYEIRNLFEDNRLIAQSDIEDYSAKILISNDSLTERSGTQFGIEWARHTISPNLISTEGSIAELLESSSTTGRIATELSTFGEYSADITPTLTVSGGMRLSAGFVRSKIYFNPEPRFSLRYDLGKDQALKFSYSRMAQYIHRISNSAVSTPTDIWYPVTEDVRPQRSHQLTVSWQRSLPANKFFLSVESYYKSMDRLIGYKEGTNLFLNTDFESRLIQGDGRAYGFEMLLRKDAGKLRGWISYSLSWSWRKFDEMNNGNWFPSRYDRRHNGAIVTQYAFNKRWSASVVWEFISGSRFTPIIGQYFMLAPTLTGVDLIPVYSELNQVRLADTHRLDIGIKFRSKPGKKFQWHWFAGVYNAYNRAAPVGINITQDDSDGSLSYEQPGLFGLLPFISYGFSF